MPWKSSSPVDQRTEFMNRIMRGERVTDLCREYGISRKTGDKFKQRFKRMGVAGLVDQSRAPIVVPKRTSPELAAIIVAERKSHPTWGPKKLKKVIQDRLKRVLPSASTIGNILDKHGLVEPRKRRPAHTPTLTGLRVANAPNDVWCIDYKGQFRLGDKTLCYPLTITDQFSRYILGCEGMSAISDDAARDVCEETFRTYGVPVAMRSDNGVPFASVGLGGLTKLAVYWLRLGIALERIRPAHPEENGRHERMHRTLKFETTRPSRGNLLQQQERFDQFVEEFNNERPHEGIEMKRPADVYERSAHPHPESLAELDYPEHDDVLAVRRDGSVRFLGRLVYFSAALAGQNIGIREERDGRWVATFMRLDLGHFTAGRTFVAATTSTPPEAI